MIVLYNTKYNNLNLLKTYFDSHNVPHIYVEDYRINDEEINNEILYLQKDNNEIKIIVCVPNLLGYNIITNFKKINKNLTSNKDYESLKNLVLDNEHVYEEYRKWFTVEILRLLNLKLKDINLTNEINFYNFKNIHLLLVREDKVDRFIKEINEFANINIIIPKPRIKESMQNIKVKRKVMLNFTKNELSNILRFPIIKNLNYIDIYNLKKEMANNIYSNFYNQDFLDYVKDKRVVIVGPASYLEGLGKGSEFDKYDIVVRVNRGLGLLNAKKDYGSRCDVLYHCMSQHKENGGNIVLPELVKHNVSHLRACYPPLQAYEESSFKTGGTIRDYNNFNSKFSRMEKTKFTYVGKEFYLKHENSMGTRPNSGIVGILDLLNTELKELYITGFTFFKDGYNKNYRDSVDGVKIGTDHGASLVKKRLAVHGVHKQQKIIDYVKKILLNNKRVKLDKQVINAMSS